MAAWADSCITSPSLPVIVSLPLPGMMVTSVASSSPPSSVQARPVATPTLAASSPLLVRNFGAPRYFWRFLAVTTTWAWRSVLTTSTATLRQTGAVSLSSAGDAGVPDGLLERRGNPLERVRGSDENHVRRVVVVGEIVVVKRRVLIGIE